MAAARLTIDLAAIVANWRALAAMSRGETGAVVKADAYGLGAARVAPALMAAGARSFFVALAEEGAALRAALGPLPRIFVFSGIMPGEAPLIRAANLIPLLNSRAQALEAKALAASLGRPLSVGLQLDTGMNRLGLEPADLSALLAAPDGLAGLDLALVMSHLACADEPDHPMNAAQREAFRAMTAHPVLSRVPRSLGATGGVLLGPDFHYDMTRPGVGLYGGLPFAEARPVVTLEAPIVQVREVAEGEAVGYGAAWRADAPRRIATISVGYADGLHRALSAGFTAWLGAAPLPSAGRVSMDLITLDATQCPEARDGAFVTLLGPGQGVDDLAAKAGTIGYEILTSLGARYARRYTGGD
ncbi:MAG: alanine racemase [Pikeienuella sp.]|uniref:alanine racemase n=1 Tax=Pikeienuella sp. TaxID=2831957 RepID=UPI00391C255B